MLGSAPKDMKQRAVEGRLNRPSPSKKIDQSNNDGQNQQCVNHGTRNVKGKTQKPEDQKDRSNCPQHLRISTAGIPTLVTKIQSSWFVLS
jgi:hypothetical protein